MPQRPDQPLADGHGEWIDRALRAYEDRNLTQVTWARSVMFGGIWLWLLVNYGIDVALEQTGVLALLVTLGLMAYVLMHGRADRLWLQYLFVLLDALLLAYTLLAPGRTYPEGWPWPMALRSPLFLFFLTVPALAALSFRPLLVLWAGLVVSLTLAGSTWLIAQAPGSIVGMGDPPPGTPASETLRLYLEPGYVNPDDAVVRVFVVMTVSAIMAYGAARARRLVFEQAAAARERANLARYVAPSMVDRLARNDNPLAQVRSQEVAVLFCDIRGFTAMAEAMSPEATMRLLREFHARMGEVVFAHEGTLDKFIGDELMATFGTPEAAPDDAARALACATAMLAALERWNAERGRDGEPPVAVGIGLHHGPVITGDIGGAGRLEFAVIGDTVNVAERLQELTRTLGVALLASEAVLRRAGIADPAGLGFTAVGLRRLRGRAAPMTLWGRDGPPAVAGALPRAAV